MVTKYFYNIFLFIIVITIVVTKLLKVSPSSKDIKLMVVFKYLSLIIIIFHFLVNNLFKLFSVHEYAIIESYIFFIIILPMFIILQERIKVVASDHNEIVNTVSDKLFKKSKSTTLKSYAEKKKFFNSYLVIKDKLKYVNKEMKKVNILLVIIFVFSFIDISYSQAKLVKSSESYIELIINHKEFHNVIHVGTNTNFTFLYNKKNKKTIVVSNVSILYMKK